MKVYYDLLGLTENCTLDELKQAYRRRAMELHPDRNKHPNAAEQFIQVQQAFEYLYAIKLINPSAAPTTDYKTTPPKYKTAQAANDPYDGWMHNSAHIVREQFQTAEQYKAEQQKIKKDRAAVNLVNSLIDYVLYLIGFLLVCGVVYYDILHWKELQQFGFIVSFALAGIGAIIMRACGPFPLKKVAQDVWLALSSRAFLIFLCIVFNVVICFKIGFRTLIPLSALFLAYALSIGATKWMLTRTNLIKTKLDPAIVMGCLAPLAMSLLLLLNFCIHFNTVTETYQLETFEQNPENQRKASSLITLNNHAYQNYIGIRLFYNIRDIRSNKIRFTFARGIFGLRVMTDYEFMPDLYEDELF